MNPEGPIFFGIILSGIAQNNLQSFYMNLLKNIPVVVANVVSEVRIAVKKIPVRISKSIFGSIFSFFFHET